MTEIKEVSIEEIPELIKTSLKIFQPNDGEQNSHHQIEKWQQHLDEGGVILGLYVDDKLVGYNFGYPVDDNQWHYWMGGILEEYPGNGHGRKLLEKQEVLAKEAGFKEITVNTYKHMWSVQFVFAKVWIQSV